MKYRYARGAAGAVHDVHAIDREQRCAHTPFVCLGCGRELLAVLGSQREKHFRHKSDGEATCTKESYLHALAKKIIVASLKKAIYEKQPYALILRTETVCRRWQQELGFICKCQNGERKYNLTEHFDEVKEEGTIDRFRADILLSSSKSGEKLLIEIAVTHKCETIKVASGLRIIEINITDECSIDAIAREISEFSDNVTFHNFKTQKPLEKICRTDCDSRVTAFHVFRSGKTFLHSAHPTYVAEVKRRQSTVYTSVIPNEGRGTVLPILIEDGYHREAWRAYRSGAPIRNCCLCRFAGFDTYEKPVFCKLQRKEVNNNEAVGCKAYRPTSTSFGQLRRY